MSDRIQPSDIFDPGPGPTLAPSRARKSVSTQVDSDRPRLGKVDLSRLGAQGQPLRYDANGDGWTCAIECTYSEPYYRDGETPGEDDAHVTCTNCGVTYSICHRCGEYECLDHLDVGTDNVEQWW